MPVARLFLVILLMTAGQLTAQDLLPGSAARVQEILRARCSECHGPELARPKADFGFVHDLEAVTEDYVSPGSLEDSSLWGWLNDDGEDRMPPLKAKAGPITPEEMALIRWWITAGAPAPVADVTTSEDVVAEESARDGASMLGRFHPLFVHFPIALLLAALLAEVLSLRGGWGLASQVARFCLALGAFSAVASVTTGLIAADRPGSFPEVLDRHKLSGIITAGLALVGLFANELRHRRGTTPWPARLVLLAAAVLVAFSAHQGGELVYGEDWLF
ncbi:MAG: hypothetical protein KDB53_20395 [Planctomycetes bacterium]|nr:hypothetical protein [Planctomycetota bacterium]